MAYMRPQNGPIDPRRQAQNGLQSPVNATGTTNMGALGAGPGAGRGLSNGQPGPLNGNPGGAQPLQSAGPATGGTGFVNLQRYLELNHGVGTGVAGAMSSDLQARGDKAAQTIGSVNQATGQGDIEGAQGYMKGASGSLGQDVKDVGFLGKEMGSQAGRESYLAQQNPNHTAGVNSLDAFLGGASGLASQPGADKYQGLQSMFNGAQGDLTYQQDAQAADPTYEQRNKDWLRTSKKPGFIEN